MERELFEKYLSLPRPKFVSWSWIHLFAWRDFFKYDFQVIDGHLCVFAADEAGTFMYLPPLGERPAAKVFEKCFERMKSRNGSGGVTRVENVPASYPGLHRIVSSASLRLMEKSRDYIYYKKDICRLKGNAYKSHRAARNQFVRNTACVYRPYRREMREECLSLYRGWAKERRKNHDDMYRYMLDDNERVHERLLKHAPEAGLTGRVIEINGRIKAYTFGFALTRHVFCVLLEITDRSFNGLAVWIFQNFCADPVLRRYSFINVMDDCGFPALAQTKMSYRPVILEPVYILTQEAAR